MSLGFCTIGVWIEIQQCESIATYFLESSAQQLSLDPQEHRLFILFLFVEKFCFENPKGFWLDWNFPLSKN